MTGRTTTEAAHALLVQADPLPVPPAFDDLTVAAVVHRARVADPVTPARAPRPPMSPRGRSAVAAGGLVVTAAAVWAGVAALPTEGGPTGQRPTAQGGSQPAPERPVVSSPAPSTAPPVRPPTSRAPVVSTDPVVVLRDAATALTTGPAATPRPDQFLYVTESNGYQAWLSMDGTHDGLIEPADNSGAAIPVPGCRNGVAVDREPNGTATTACTPDPAYRPDLPADPDALRAYLAAQGGGSSTNDVAKEVLATLEFKYLTPATRAALFTVISTYDGLTVVDVPARPDTVGVTWSYGGGSVTLVFGRADHDVRGVLDGDGSSVDGFRSVVVDAVGQKG